MLIVSGELSEEIAMYEEMLYGCYALVAMKTIWGDVLNPAFCKLATFSHHQDVKAKYIYDNGFYILPNLRTTGQWSDFIFFSVTCGLRQHKSKIEAAQDIHVPVHFLAVSLFSKPQHFHR